MALLWLTVFSIVIYFALKRNKFIFSFSVWSILLLLAMSIIRIVGVMEFSNVKVIREAYVLPFVRMFLDFKLFSISNVNITVLTGLLSVWGLGSAFLLTRFVVTLVKTYMVISSLPTTDDEQVIRIVKEVCSSRKSVKVIKSRSVDVPMALGYFSPTILLPDVIVSDQEFRYMISHEWNHFKHGDLWIKLIVNIICIIWWWNPLVYLLKRNLDHVLEMKCDMYVTENMDILECSEYFQMIVDVCSGKIGNKNNLSSSELTARLASAKSDKQLLQRVEIGLNYKPHKYDVLIKVAFFTVMIGTFLLSYVFIIQPAEFPNDNPELYNSETDGEIFGITMEDSYLVDNGDGTYSFYSNDVYLYDVTDINSEPFSELEIKDGNTE